MHADFTIAAVLLMMGIVGCGKSRFDVERKTKERGASVESTFMTLEQARKEYGGDEATLDSMFSPAEALHALRAPFRIQAALSGPNTEPVFHEVPYSIAHRLAGELNKTENYGPPYMCVFNEDFVLRLHGSTKDLIFSICMGCDEFKITFGREPLPRVYKLSFSPELEKCLTEVFENLKQETKK